MTSGAQHYGLAAARRSLMHFVLGRGGSALAGIGVLMLLVRVMPTAEYGALVAWLAFLEIHYLVSGVGLSGIAQRYVPEFRTRAAAPDLRRLVRHALWQRLVVAVLLSALAGWAAVPLAQFIGVAVPGPVAGVPFNMLLAVLLVTGTLVRFADELLAALLMQGVSQAMALLRNLGKLPWLAVAWWSQGSVSATDMLLLESGLAAVTALVALRAIGRGLRGAAASAPDAGDAAAGPAAPVPRYRAPGMWGVCLRFYLIQVLGQIYGANALKLLVTRTLGLDATAAFGFALALVDMLRNYLPAHLLAGWIRPLLVARYVATGSVEQLSRLTGLVLKVNLLGVLAFALFFGVAGNVSGAWLSGGRFASLGALLTALMLLVGLQTAHLLLTMVTLTLERANANLLATVLACVGLPLAAWLGAAIGLVGVALGLVLAELVWISTVWFGLRRANVRLALHWPGMARLALPALPVLALALLVIQGLQWAPALAGAVAVLLFLAAQCAVRPLSDDERDVIAKFAPRRWILW